MLASTYAAHLTNVVTIPVSDAPTRAEHLIWSDDGATPAATAFLAQLAIASSDAAPSAKGMSST